MRRVGSLVAEVPVHLEHLGRAADQESLQIQLRSNTHVQPHVVGVDVRDEGPGIGTAMDRLQHRGFNFRKPRRQSDSRTVCTTMDRSLSISRDSSFTMRSTYLCRTRASGSERPLCLSGSGTRHWRS